MCFQCTHSQPGGLLLPFHLNCESKRVSVEKACPVNGIDQSTQVGLLQAGLKVLAIISLAGALEQQPIPIEHKQRQVIKGIRAGSLDMGNFYHDRLCGPCVWCKPGQGSAGGTGTWRACWRGEACGNRLGGGGNCRRQIIRRCCGDHVWSLNRR